MIERQMSNQILEAVNQYPVIAVTGPRQSGKTTLCRELFPDYAYSNLENPETRQFAIEDPNGFLAQFSKPVILDEIQRVPKLFSGMSLSKIRAVNCLKLSGVSGEKNLNSSGKTVLNLLYCAGRTRGNGMQ